MSIVSLPKLLPAAADLTHSSVQTIVANGAKVANGIIERRRNDAPRLEHGRLAMATLYWEIHPGRGPHLLLVHGFLSSRAQWRTNLDAFAEYCTPVVVELWGHGRSPRPESPGHYRPDHYLEQFESIRRALGVERWLLCGQSLGASLTLRYALRHPQRVIAQAFTNSNSALANEAALRQRLADASQAIEAIGEHGLPALEALRIHPRHAKHLPSEVHRELLDDAKRIDPAAIVGSYQNLNLESSVRAEVKDLSVPTLLAYGRFEERFAVHREFAERVIPGLQLEVFDAGHAVNIQASDAFNDRVGQFFRHHIEVSGYPS